MPRRSNASPDLPPILMLFLIVPWYVGPITAAIAYSVLRWLVPWFWPLPNGEPKTAGDAMTFVFAAFAQSGPGAAPVVAAMIVFVWLIAELLKFARRVHEGGIEWPSFSKHRSGVDSATGHGLAPSSSHEPRKRPAVSNNGTSMAASIAKLSMREPSRNVQAPTSVTPTSSPQQSAAEMQIDISKMSWKQFEKLLVQVLTRFGFQAEHTGRSGPDGGFDVRCTDSKGQTFLVQCKHWHEREVGVKVVREFLGVLVHEGVTNGLIVTSDLFTQDAKKFAVEKTLRLIDGEKLLKVMAEIPEYCDGEKLRYRISHLESAISSEERPQCAGRMIRKNGRRGAFLSCERYPDCEGSRSI